MYLGHTIRAAASLLPLASRPRRPLAQHARQSAQPRVSPAPLLLPGQGQSQELVADLPPAAPGLPGPPAVDFAALQLAVAAEEG